MEFTLNVFTLNCWGIPVVAKNRKERIEAIGNYLLKSPHNIVSLQEIWVEKDYLYLKEKLKTVLPYAHYFYSGVVGSGLCVFSKWVIQDVFFHQWSLNGYMHKVHHGDWFGGKGVGLCRLRIEDCLVNVYCSHLHAKYHADDIYLAHRVLQAHSTAEFINLTTSAADISILAGDLNTAPGELSYRILTQLPSLIDPFDIKFEGSNPAITKECGTCDHENNSYSDPKLVKESPQGLRIDHILFHINNAWKADVINFGNPLADRVPGQKFSYSDHNAVSLELKLQATDRKPIQRHLSKDIAFLDTVAEILKVCKDAMTTISRAKTFYLTVGGVLFMFLLGTVGFWPNTITYDVFKILITALCLYNILMGTIWNKIEMNSLKAGITAIENYSAVMVELNDGE